MLSKTKRALEDFDNVHDFERLAADVLNGLGFANVEPMAPGGGPDGGRDIKFRVGDTPGVAIVTLDKQIQQKFSADLAKQEDGAGVIALFCNVRVTPAMKMTFTQEAFGRGYLVDVFDLERLRSLLDSSLKDVRRRYLHIDDEVAAQLRSAVKKLLRFPSAQKRVASPPSVLEGMMVDKLPLQLFSLLMDYDEDDIQGVPGIGESLHEFLVTYYDFRNTVLQFENGLIQQIGKLVSVRFRQAWEIYYRYAMMRFAGLSQDDVRSGNHFLNFDITWEKAECLFDKLAHNTSVNGEAGAVLSMHEQLVQTVTDLQKGL